VNWSLFVIVGATAIVSFIVDEPFAANWLTLKVLLYTLTIGILIAVNYLLKPFVPAFERLMTEGSSPEVESIIKGTIDKSKPFIWAIWAIVIANAALGLFKPDFF
jgi:hypothetical protein